MENQQSRWPPIARGIIPEHPTEASTVTVNATLGPVTNQALLAEMARLLALIERHWSTHFSPGGEIDAFTVQQVHAVLAEHRQKLLIPVNVDDVHP
jgi:hypothetical protein